MPHIPDIKSFFARSTGTKNSNSVIPHSYLASLRPKDFKAANDFFSRALSMRDVDPAEVNRETKGLETRTPPSRDEVTARWTETKSGTEVNCSLAAEVSGGKVVNTTYTIAESEASKCRNAGPPAWLRNEVGSSSDSKLKKILSDPCRFGGTSHIPEDVLLKWSYEHEGKSPSDITRLGVEWPVRGKPHTCRRTITHRIGGTDTNHEYLPREISQEEVDIHTEISDEHSTQISNIASTAQNQAKSAPSHEMLELRRFARV
jgi:hypothetical protein